MKSHYWLLEALLQDSAVQCSVPPREIARDLQTISRRVESEGESFLTITLPAFDATLMQCLSKGCLSSRDFPGFRFSRGLPSFLRGFLRQVFDTSGVLLAEPNVTAIAVLHQLCNTFKKVQSECKNTRVEAVLKGYCETDASLPDRRDVFLLSDGDPNSLTEVIRLTELQDAFRVLFVQGLLPLDRKVYEREPLDAKHGPGATADRLKGNEKYRCDAWTERLDRVFFSDQYLHAFEGHGLEEPSSLSLSTKEVTPAERELPVRVITVPKTMKGPRVIAIEPTVMQYMQQGLLSGITEHLRSSFIWQSMKLDDQSENGRKALLGSLDGSYATLDLSEASDRVSHWLVEDLFRPYLPNLWEALDATRSRSAQISGLRGSPLIRLKKFASMGSATCFPVESIVFTTLAFYAFARSRGTPLTLRYAKRIAKHISVFGDDIIVPADVAPLLVRCLEAVGLKVNMRKTHLTGRFRESCGIDAFKGVEITPAYLKTFVWASSRTLDWLALWVEFSNSLYQKGFWETARIIRKRIARLGFRIPMVSATSPALGYHNIRGTYEWSQWDSFLQRPLVKAFSYRSIRFDSLLDGRAALLKCLSTPFNEDPKHLVSAVRSASVSTKKRWMSPF